jgi:hypothetical protein
MRGAAFWRDESSSEEAERSLCGWLQHMAQCSINAPVGGVVIALPFASVLVDSLLSSLQLNLHLSFLLFLQDAYLIYRLYIYIIEFKERWNAHGINETLLTTPMHMS